MVDQTVRVRRSRSQGWRVRWHEGRIGGQAEVPGVGGPWRDLTESVNVRRAPHQQVRNIAPGDPPHVAKGDLPEITGDARGGGSSSQEKP